jgi:hypothetical protein
VGASSLLGVKASGGVGAVMVVCGVTALLGALVTYFFTGALQDNSQCRILTTAPCHPCTIPIGIAAAVCHGVTSSCRTLRLSCGHQLSLLLLLLLLLFVQLEWCCVVVVCAALWFMLLCPTAETRNTELNNQTLLTSPDGTQQAGRDASDDGALALSTGTRAVAMSGRGTCCTCYMVAPVSLPCCPRQYCDTAEVHLLVMMCWCGPVHGATVGLRADGTLLGTVTAQEIDVRTLVPLQHA